MKALIRFFAESKLSPLMVVAAILLGLMALADLPREEEPQIKVPMVDIFVQFPGGTPQEVQKRVVELGERKLWEIPDVEYIYTQAGRENALFILRFKVGTNPDTALLGSYVKVMSNADLMPAGAPMPLVKSQALLARMAAISCACRYHCLAYSESPGVVRCVRTRRSGTANAT